MRAELDHATSAVATQLAAYRKLVAARAGETATQAAPSAFDEFEGLFFNNMTLVLDRYFAHRLRMATGKVGSPAQ